jgi:hypothetical protein
MFVDNQHTKNKCRLHGNEPGNKSGRIGKIFGKQGLRLACSTFAAFALWLTPPLRAQVVQTFSVQEFFGVSHPDQILEFGLSNSVNPSLSYMIGPGGTEVPYQLVRGNKLALRGDLPANTTRTWQLMSGRAPASFSDVVQVTETSEYYEVVNGVTGVRVVKPTAAGALNLAPIQGIRIKDGRWTATGPNRLYEQTYAFHTNRLIPTAKSMAVTILERGPMKVVIQVSNAYDRPLWQYGADSIPAGPGYYVSTIELQAGQPSILIEDDTDMEFRYSLNVYDVVQPNQGRYRAHHADTVEWGFKADGSIYNSEHLTQRPPEDAFRNFDYGQPLFDSDTTLNLATHKRLKRISSWNRWEANTGRQYWMIYNSGAAADGAIIGAFPARASRAIGSHNTGPGPYFIPNDGTGQRAAGISFQAIHRGPEGTIYPKHRFSWGLFVGDKGTDLRDSKLVQNIGKQHNLHGGFSLNKIKDYGFTFPDPVQGYGRMFMEPEILLRMITRLRSGDSTYYNALRGAEPYSQALLDMWADATGTKTRAAAAETRTVANTLLNTYINGNGIHDIAYGYWQGSREMTAKALIIDSVLADPLSTASDKTSVKAVAVLFGNMLLDNDFVPVDNSPVNPIGLGTANMPVQWAGGRNLFTSFLATHPIFNQRLPQAFQDVLSALGTAINDDGASISTPHYTQASVTPTVNSLLQLRMAGVNDPFAVEPRIRKFAEFYMNLMTPPEVRFGGQRKIIAASDGSTEGEPCYLFGELATGFKTADPVLSRRLQGAWLQSGKVHSGFWASTLLMIDELAPSADPLLGKDHYSGYASVLRNNWGTPHETVLWLFNGDWYIDHRHYLSGTGPTDHGSIVLYALGAPLSINWGSFYTPQTLGGGMKSGLMPESRFSSWSSGYGLTEGAGWRSSSNEAFAAFSQSAFSSARMRSFDGLEWNRRAYSLHPRTDLPVIFIQDDFAGSNPAQPKIALFNLMAQGSVGTPGGAITPQVVTGGTPTGGPGFTLGAGLNRLAFTGQSWPRHPTGGIDWDIYTSSAESLTGNVGNWGHTWHPNTEQVQFLQANGRAFEEHQHILRVRGNGSFRTFILPFRKGEKPADLQVRQNGANLEITTLGQITTISDHWYAFTNTQRRVLTTFSSAQAQAFGLSASGGPTEVILEANRALITAHGIRGQRRVKIPATWKPVISGVVATQEFGEWVLNYDSEAPVTIVLE